MRRIILLFSLLLTGVFASAANDRYLFDIGVLGGCGYYAGDAAPHIFQNVRPAYGGMLRYKMGYRWAVSAKVLKGDIKFDYTEAQSGYNKHGSNDLLTADLTVEYNFFQLATAWVDRYAHPFSPYVFVGLGMNTQSEGRPISGYLPFGVGFKWRMSPRWSLQLAWQHQLQFNDNLEGVDALNNVRGLNGGDFFNNDVYSSLTLGITFGFCRAKGVCRTCDEAGHEKNGSVNDWIGF